MHKVGCSRKTNSGGQPSVLDTLSFNQIAVTASVLEVRKPYRLNHFAPTIVILANGELSAAIDWPRVSNRGSAEIKATAVTTSDSYVIGDFIATASAAVVGVTKTSVVDVSCLYICNCL